MFDFGLLREVLQSLNKNKLRTLLSGFTVAFAIMLFTILFGIANGFQNTFKMSLPEMQKIQFSYTLGVVQNL